MLYKRYTYEMIPALADLGGGSGCGAMFFQEPGWPEEYNNVPMMCDWGRGQVIIHRVEPDGPSFTQKPENFIKVPKVTDIDNDGSSRLFISSWHNSGFTGGNSGFIAQVVPADWTYKPAPDLKKATDVELVKLMASASSKTRLHAQQELISRGPSAARTKALTVLATHAKSDVEHRIAAIFGLKQIDGKKSHKTLLKLVEDEAVAEWAIRALADRVSENEGMSIKPFVKALSSTNPRVQVAAAVALGRIGDKAAAPELLKLANPPKPHWKPVTSGDAAAGSSDKSAERTFKSDLVKNKDIKDIDVDISGFKSLFLIVDEGGNGSGNDHGVWFDPILVMKDGSEKKLTDLKWASATQGWGKTLVDKSCQGHPLKRPDGKPHSHGIGTHSPSVIEYKNLPEGVSRLKASIGSSNGRVTSRFLVSNSRAAAPKKGKANIPEGPHATPNPDIIIPHIAKNAVVALNAIEESLNEVGGDNNLGALWALRFMYDTQAVDGLIAKLNSEKDSATRQHIAMTLIRLIHREKEYKGNTWWGTKPDTRGPFYYPTAWEQTDKIKKALIAAYHSGDAGLQKTIATLTEKDRAPIDGLTKKPAATATPTVTQPTVDLNAIKNKKGQIAKMAVEDVILALDKVKGDAKKGKALFTQQGCIACHSLDQNEAQKGPFMGQIGSIMKADQIAMSILRPDAEISQGFKTVEIKMKDGKVHQGFITKRLSDLIEIRNIAGIVTTLKPNDIASEKLLPNSMMPAGLANGMSLEDFSSLVTFLAQQK